MAIAATANLQGNSSTAGTAFSTILYDPGLGGRLLVIGFQHNQTGTGVADATSVTGACMVGSAATKILTKPIDTIAAAHSKLELWAAITSTSSSVITFNFGATQNTCVWFPNEVTGMDTTQGTMGIVQTVSNSTDTAGTAASATFGTFGSASNGAMGFLGATAGSDSTSGSGWTRLGDTANTSLLYHCASQWRANNATVADWTITGGSARWAAIGVELAVPPTSSIWPRAIRYVKV